MCSNYFYVFRYIQCAVASVLPNMRMITCFDSCDVFQGACIMCIFNIFLWKCNMIYVDKGSNVVFSEIKS